MLHACKRFELHTFCSFREIKTKTLLPGITDQQLRHFRHQWRVGKRQFPTSVLQRETPFYFGQKQRESLYQGLSSFKGSSKLSSTPKLNPMNRRGEVSRCAIVTQKFIGLVNSQIYQPKDYSLHMSLKKMMVNLMKVMKKVSRMMLLTDDTMNCAIFVARTEKSAVVDTVCYKTVVGEQWLNSYMKILTDTLLDEVGIFESHRIQV